MNADDIAIGRYIVCGPVWYEVVRIEGERVETTVATGSDALLGRRVVFYRRQIAAMLRIGECRVRDGPPPGPLPPVAPDGRAGVKALAGILGEATRAELRSVIPYVLGHGDDIRIAVRLPDLRLVTLARCATKTEALRTLAAVARLLDALAGRGDDDDPPDDAAPHGR